MLRAALFALLLPSAALAERFACSGEGDWTLTFDDTQARLVFPAPTEMDVMLVTPAEGADWPRAYSLIGESETAIVLLEQEACGTEAFRVHVLTPNGRAAAVT